MIIGYIESSMVRSGGGAPLFFRAPDHQQIRNKENRGHRKFSLCKRSLHSLPIIGCLFSRSKVTYIPDSPENSSSRSTNSCTSRSFDSLDEASESVASAQSQMSDLSGQPVTNDWARNDFFLPNTCNTVFQQMDLLLGNLPGTTALLCRRDPSIITIGSMKLS